MKRTMLSLTTAIALAGPALAQDNFDAVIEDALATYGYAEENIATLTEAERSEIYLTATSEDATDLRSVLAGMDLKELPMPADLAAVPADDNTEATVEDALVANGYEAATIEMLTQAEIAQIYLTATSGEAADVTRAIDGLALDRQAQAAPATPADSSEEVLAYLRSEGYTEEEIAAISQAEIAEIYIALTSGDTTSINNAIAGAINS